MPSELTLYTKDKLWKADLAAWMIKFRFYKSIGTYVTVYRLQHTHSIWGGSEHVWIVQPAQRICTRNVYSGAGNGIATREHEWRNATDAELKEWSMGGPILVPADATPSEEGAAIVDIAHVEGTVTIVIANETLGGTVVSAAASEQAAAA